MHLSVLNWLKSSIKEEEFKDKAVLEIGSIHSSIHIKPTPRKLISAFNPSSYLGIDERKGLGVDEVYSAYDLDKKFPPSSLDSIICLEVLEHARDWYSLLQQITYALKPSGTLYLSCRSINYPYHLEPTDFWRFSLSNIQEIFTSWFTTISEDPECPGVFLKAVKLPSSSIEFITPHLIKESQPSFTIVTPTLLKPSLITSISSIDSQDYSNWEHLIIIDDPTLSKPLDSPKRRWFQCLKNHNNVGNSCRASLFNEIHSDYVLYLDDDNYYSPNAFHSLAAELVRLNLPQWGTFPMLYCGERFCDPKPCTCKVDTNQIYHKPLINNTKAIYPSVNSYCGDGIFVDWMTTLAPPTVLSNLPNITTMPYKSLGSNSLPPTPSYQYNVVVPTYFHDIFSKFISAIDTYIIQKPKVLAITNNPSVKKDYITYLPYGPGPFVFSKAANQGFAASEDKDVILINDDAFVLTFDLFNTLNKQAYSNPKIGILAPIVKGDCGNLLMNYELLNTLWHGEEFLYSEGTAWDYLSFPCVYIKRALINSIGLMDENFKTYGKDDADYCIRAARAGWKLAITPKAIVQHGSGILGDGLGKSYSSSFNRFHANRSLTIPYFYSKYPEQSKIPIWPSIASTEGKSVIKNRVRSLSSPIQRPKINAFKFV